MTITNHPLIAGSDTEECVQYMGKAPDGELLAIVGFGHEVTLNSVFHHKSPNQGDWMYWGTRRELAGWLPDPELPAYNSKTKVCTWKNATTQELDPNDYNWEFVSYPFGDSQMVILEVTKK
jgi:hypothetical protein